MSQENVEVVRRAYEVFNQQGAETVISSGLWSPEIVFDPSPTGIPGLGVYRGYDEVRRFFDGEIVRFDIYRDREALEAAGLSE